MSNYCGIGIDAELSLDFHQAREEEPGKFTSRCHGAGVGAGLALATLYFLGVHQQWPGAGAPRDCRSPARFHNKGVYVRAGLQKLSHPRGLHRALRLQAEQQEVELPSIEGLIFINIPRCPHAGLPGPRLPSSLPPGLPLTCVPLPLGAAGARGPTCGAPTVTRDSRSRAWMTGCWRWWG